jgi:hypothetical protein
MRFHIFVMMDTLGSKCDYYFHGVNYLAIHKLNANALLLLLRFQMFKVVRNNVTTILLIAYHTENGLS